MSARGPLSQDGGALPYPARSTLIAMKKLLSSALVVCALAASLRADTALVFNEIMYHPAFHNNAMAESNHEWIEFYNQLAVDLDVSGWRVGGEVDFTFPVGTRVPGRGFIVVAANPAVLTSESGITNVLGPFSGRLGNDGGGPLKLYNNSGRVVDHVDYGTEGDWPVAPDGAGVSLAKRDRDLGSPDARNWTQSAEIGGTPGRDNFALPSNVRLIAVDAVWKYEASGTDLGTAWRDLNYADAGWSARYGVTNRAISGLFNTGVDANGNSLADGASDPHYILSYAAQGTVGANATVTQNHPAWAANDAFSKWISVVNPGTTTIAGGGYGYKTTFSIADFILGTVNINFSVAIDNAMTNVFLNGVGTGLGFTGFAAFSDPFTLSSGLVNGVNTLEFGTENQGAGPGAFRAKVSGSGLAVNTNAPLPLGNTTYYFRKSFNFPGNPQYATLTLRPILADGAVFYLNGVEVYRQNMPVGPISYSTPALSNVSSIAYSGPITIPTGSLIAGSNVLAVEVHQANGSADAPLLGTELVYSASPERPVTLVFNELSSTNAPFWVELFNYGTNSIPLNGYIIEYDLSGGAPVIDYALPNITLPPGAFLALTNVTAPYPAYDDQRLFLFASNKTAVLDGVVLKKGPRARSPDGTGAWLVPNAPTPGTNNSFLFHNEIVINEIMYHHKAFPPVATNIPPKDNHEAWIELYNRSSNTVDLTDWELAGGIKYKFNLGKTMAPGAYLIVADDQQSLRAAYPGLDIVGDLGGKLSHGDDRIILKDPLGNPADEVHYYSSGRWPEYADGGGSSLELRNPNADNSAAEAWAPSDESGKSSWQYYSYRGVANIPSGSGQPTQWNDFILGLLGAGECLIDDIEVIESPASAPVAFIANGNFESGLTGWRAIGTHGQTEVIVDPENPGNHVLHLVATGPQEHMHNHIETTYIGGHVVTAGREYQISYRAKWLAGNNLLNTRLYFNRVARTTPLSYPQRNGTPGAPNSRFVPNIGPTFSGFQHQPVIPQPNETVTVSVTAQDPQGVGSCNVWWSTNSGPWSNAPMTHQGAGVYRGTIPGFAAGTIVQFYVRGTDTLGAVATYPAAGTNSGALYAVADGQANLALGHNVRIILTPANVNLLHGNAQGVNQTNVMSNANIPGTVVMDEKRAYYDVGVRLKGSERGRYSDTRVSFHLEFPPDDLFRGVHPFMLVDRSGAGDSTANKQQEILIKHILLRAGNIPSTQPDMCRVIAPRSIHTGPAIFSPRHEDEFISTAFENGGDGTMWELELIYYPTSANSFGYKLPQPDAVVGTDISNLTDDKEFYRYNFILKNHRDADDYNRFITFGKTLSLANNSQLDLESKLVMDVDEWMRVWAGVTLCGVGDTYTYGNNHNLFMYARPSDQRMLAFPVDMDFSFNQATTAALVGNQNLSRVINLPGNLRAFYGHILDLINTSYNAAYMSYWVSHYQSFAPGQDYSAVLSYITARANFAISTINSAGGNAPFVVNGNSTVTTGNNLVTLSGTAPVTMKMVTIDGVAYPITWTSVSAWTMTFPVASPTNQINVEGRDLSGAIVATSQRTIVLTNAPVDPRGVIVFNEIMYNPALPDAGYVELFNTSSNVTFDLSGWRINGLDFTFPSGSIITNRQYLVVAANIPAYASVYGVGGGAPVGFFSGNLQNDGETLTLVKPAGSSNEVEVVVDKVRYESVLPWSTNANGTGSSLQLIDPNQENARVGNWFSSFTPAVYCCSSFTPARTNDGWRFVSVTGNAGGGIVGGQMRLMIYLGSELGSAWLDDISLVAGSNAGVGPNFIRNGDFESGPLLENPELTNSWSIGTNYTNTMIVSDLVHSGNGALKVAASSFGNAFPRIISQLLSPAPVTNTINTLSFWFWATNASTNLNIRLQNSSQLSVATNLNITITPSNYVPPQLVSPATNTLSPGAANQNVTSLPPFPSLWINEVQAENLTGITDNQGEHEPWIEIVNTSTNTVSLAGLYLSDNYTNLANWAFPPGASIGPTQFLVLFCDGEASETSGSEYHTSFRLPPASGSIALSRLYNGAPQVLDYVNYAGLHSDKSFGSYPDGQPFERLEFFYVTPRGTNDGRSAPLVVSINEWMAANTSTLADPADGDFDDWFELYNPSGNTVDLAGYYLTDTAANKTKYLITTNGPHTIAPHGYLLVWADNETGQNVSGGVPRADLHVNFQLAAAGEAIGLYAADGSQIDLVTFTNQTNDISMGRCPDGSANIITMTNATPRQPNTGCAIGNLAPVLGAIGNKTVYLGQTLTFTATATDADVPAQQLTFSLDAGAPAGATINANTGAFSWTPSALGTVNITVRVTDNGVPVLTDFETISVQVIAGPSFTSTVRRGTNLELTWGTQAGRQYAVDYKNDLNAATWTPLVTNTATGNFLSFTNPTTSPPMRFYRIRLVN